MRLVARRHVSGRRVENGTIEPVFTMHNRYIENFVSSYLEFFPNFYDPILGFPIYLHFLGILCFCFAKQVRNFVLAVGPTIVMLLKRRCQSLPHVSWRH